jgi:hypothetical protein
MVTAFDGVFAAVYERATIEVLGFPPLRQEKTRKDGARGIVGEPARGFIAVLMNCDELGGLNAVLLLVQLNTRGESP